jgi:ADP-heptose:LPS heptosyltransferase
MRILVVHAGGLGDLVLAQVLFAALRDRWPGARLELAARADVAPAAALYAVPPDVVHTFPFDPYRWAVPSPLIAAEIRALASDVGHGVDLLIAAELRGTWLAEALAALLRPGEAILPPPRGGRATFDLSLLFRLLDVPAMADVQRLAGEPDEHELDRYARLAGAGERRLPALRIISAPAASDPWLAVFPSTSLALKRWPLERIAAATDQIAARHGLTPVIVGSTSELALLERTADACSEQAEVYAANGGGLAELAARLASADGFLSVDSGLAHLSGALGVPGVTVFGGGIWAPYAPWAPGSAGVVAPIPCFGCGWDCAFQRSFCIEGVDVPTVVETYRETVRGAPPRVVTVAAYTAGERTILAAADAVHRPLQADRAARLVAITRVRDLFRRYARRVRARERRNAAALLQLTSAAEQAVFTLVRSKEDGSM